MSDFENKILCNDIEITIEGSWGTGAVTLDEWIRNGYPRRIISIKGVKCLDNNQKLTIDMIPLPYRYDLLSNFLLGTGTLKGVEDSWKAVNVKKRLVEDHQEFANLEIKSTDNSTLVIYENIILPISKELKVGILQVGFFGFFVITDTPEWFSDDSLIIDSVGILFTVIFSQGAENTTKRNIPDKSFIEINRLDFDHDLMNNGELITYYSEKNDLTLVVARLNLIFHSSMIIYAVSKTKQFIGNKVARILENIVMM